MRKELDDQLVERYPAIFRDRDGDMRSTAMCWGFECGDGWYDLIDVLCAEIAARTTENGLAVAAVQVKEKYGGLRFYVHGGDEFVRALIWMAEALSLKICETCGAPGMASGGGWIETRCAKHSRNDLEMVSDQVEADEDAPVFVLPPVQTEALRHVALVLQETVDNDIKLNDLPQVFVDEVIEDDGLVFNWSGGDADGRAAGLFRLAEAYSARLQVR